MSKRAVKVWIDEDFKKALKSEAALEGKSMTEYSRELAKRLKKKKGGLDLGF